jgi:hypothetical protein
VGDGHEGQTFIIDLNFPYFDWSFLIPVQQGLKNPNPPADGRDGKADLAADLSIAEPAALPHVINQHVAADHVCIRYASRASQPLNIDIQNFRRGIDDLTKVHIIDKFIQNRNV